VTDSAACALLALEAAGRTPGHVSPLGWLALGATSLLVYAYGMAANDWADRRRDRALAPGRPLPSGALSPGVVAAALVVLAAGAIALGGGPASHAPFVVAALAAATAYDFALKHTLWGGAVAMACARGSNAALVPAALVAAGAVDAWVFLAPLCVGLYSAAITVLSTTEQGAAPRRMLVSRALVVIAFGGAATLSWVVAGIPTLGVVLGYGVVTSTLFGRTPRPGSPKRQVFEMLLAYYFLDAALASGARSGSWPLALGVLLGAILLVWLSQRFARALR
jgi:hypothetical protein